MSEQRRTVYSVINSSSAPFFLAMILAPRSRFTRALVGRASPLFIALGAAYDVLLASGASKQGKMIDFRDPEAVRAALAEPDAFLAGWTHYIAFDLFVGRWIWQDALDRGKTARVALLLTWMAGPAGLSLYLLGRRTR